MMRRFARLMVIRSESALVICLPTPEVTEAYLDPGTGGAFVGGLFAVNIFWSRIRAFCRSLLIWV